MSAPLIALTVFVVAAVVMALLFFMVGAWIDGSVDGEGRDELKSLGKDNYENPYAHHLPAAIYDMAYRHGVAKKDRVARNKERFDQ